MPFFVKYFNITQSERVTTSVKCTRVTRGSPWRKLVATTTIWIPASANGAYIMPVTKSRSITGIIINGVRIIWCWPDCKLEVVVTVGVIQRIKKGLRRPGISITRAPRLVSISSKYVTADSDNCDSRTSPITKVVKVRRAPPLWRSMPTSYEATAGRTLKYWV